MGCIAVLFLRLIVIVICVGLVIPQSDSWWEPSTCFHNWTSFRTKHLCLQGMHRCYYPLLSSVWILVYLKRCHLSLQCMYENNVNTSGDLIHRLRLRLAGQCPRIIDWWQRVCFNQQSYANSIKGTFCIFLSFRHQSSCCWWCPRFHYIVDCRSYSWRTLLDHVCDGCVLGVDVVLLL